MLDCPLCGRQFDRLFRCDFCDSFACGSCILSIDIDHDSLDRCDLCKLNCATEPTEYAKDFMKRDK